MKTAKSFKTTIFTLLMLAIILCGALGVWTLTAGAEENATCAVCSTGVVTNGICDNASCTQPYQAPEVIDGENDPLKVQYAIKNAGNLYWYAALVNGGIDGKEQNINANAVLLNDIDLNPGYTFTIDASYNLVVKQGDETVTDLSVLRTWTPIGQHSAINRYNGTFIGNDKTIRGVYINGTSDKQGLFAVLEGISKVSHVKVENSYVRGNGNVGGIAGYKSGTVEWCTFDGTVVGSADNVGGIVGYNNAKTVSNCENNGTVVGSARYVGGIVGYNKSQDSQAVSDCVNNGTVVGTCNSDSIYDVGAGGIAGYNSRNSSVKNCENNGLVSTSSYYYSGGIVGYNKGSVSYCENYGSVTGGSRTGGVVGYSYGGEITYSHNTGTVQGTQYVGGVVGLQHSDAVSYCYNTGSVEGKWNDESDYYYGAVGGIVGEFTGDAINACYNTGAVTATGAGNYVGGLVGRLYSNAAVSNSFNKGAVTATNDKSYVGGVAGSTSYNNSSGSVSNCYYLTGTASIGIGNTSEDTANSAEVKTAEQFASGSVCSAMQDTHLVDDNGVCAACEAFAEPPVIDGVYQISTAEQLYWFASLVNGEVTVEGVTASSAKAILVDDIDLNPGYTFTMGENNALVVKRGNETVTDLSALRQWTPIGTDSRSTLQLESFTGIFDGNGHRVTGLYISGSDLLYEQGLFGNVGIDGIVRNVIVADSYVKGGNMIGAIVGRNSGGTVANCANSGTVIQGQDNLGGIVGRNETGNVNNCYNAGTVIGTGSYVGGIIGYNVSTDVAVSNCYYLAGSATVGTVSQNGIGSSDSSTPAADTASQTASKTAEQFASGEVAWLLNGGSSDRGAKQATNSVWFQALGENGDVAPVLTAVYDPTDSTKSTNSIYRYIIGGTCAFPAYSYANAETDHDFVACVHDETNAYTADNFTETADGAVCSICGKVAVASVVYSTVTEYYTVFTNALARANTIANAKLTLFADVENDFEISGNVILELGDYRITETVTVAEGATLQIGDVALTNTLNVQNNGTLQRSAGYDPSNATDMGYLNLVNMVENEVKTVVNQQVITGELNVTLDQTELSYVGKETKPTVIVKVGDTVLTENTHYTLTWSDNVTNVGDKNVSVAFKACVQTASETVAQREFSWRILKGTLKAENVKAAYEYGSDKTTAKVSEFDIVLNGADEGFLVEGTWSAVTYNEAEQKYCVTFTVADSQKENINGLTVELTDESFFTTAVDIERFVVVAPEWMIPDDSLTLSATGFNPYNGDDAIRELKLTYWYKIGDSAWAALNDDGLALTATDLNGADTVLVKVTADGLGGKYNAAESEVVTLTVKTTSDVIVNLENAVEDLNASTTEDLKELAEKITALDTAMKNAEDAIAKAATKEAVSAIEAALKEADKTMQDALNTLTAKVNGIDAQVTANKNDVATLKAALQALTDEDLNALSTKDAELSAAITNLETNLNTTIEGLTDRIQALENQIGELESKDSGLQVFTIIVCVISGIALCGSGAFAIWFFIDRKKKL